MELPNGVTLDDLPPEQRELAELVGMDIYMRLVERYGGLRQIYIPALAEVTRRARNEQIRQNFDGYNFSELARKYGLTEMSIRVIVKDKTRELRARPINGQTDLFG